jgi:hypothetical protein
MQEFNMKPGPRVGKILNNLLEIILDDPSKNKRETLLSIAAEKLLNEKRRVKTV